MNDLEKDSRLVVFIAPDQNASASITYGEGGTVSADQGVERLITQSLKEARVIAKTKNPDGSVTAEIEFTNEDLGGRVHGFMRLAVTRDSYYVLLFAALVDEFARYESVGKTMMNSLKTSQ